MKQHHNFDKQPCYDREDELIANRGDLYLGKHLSLHFTIQPPIWEFHVLPFFDISEWRILMGWLCFSIQYTF